MYTFSQKVKSELLKINTTRKNSIIELTILLLLNGKFINMLSDDHSNIVVTTENKIIASRLFTLISNSFKIYSNISVSGKNGKYKYKLCVMPSDGSLRILQSIKYSVDSLDYTLFKTFDDYKSLIRACFLSNGYINSPEKSYHLEFILPNIALCKQLEYSLSEFGIKFTSTQKNNNTLIYIKDSESISNLLNIIGAHNNLFAFENTRLLKGMRNNINRKVNFETANLARVVNASLIQIKNIKFIRDTVGLDRLEPQLKEVAILRLNNENASLKELGEMCNPKISKSGINHRLRKINEFAEDLY